MRMVPVWPAVLIAVSSVVSPAAAQVRNAANPPDAAAAKVAFGRLASLEGDWSVRSSDAATGQVYLEDARFSYRRTGGGSTVIEWANQGTPDEMLSVFFLDGDRLILQHYCSAGNQPRMALVAASDEELVFDLVGGTGFEPSRDGHIHSVRFVFPAVGPASSFWSWNEEGEEHHVNRRVLQSRTSSGPGKQAPGGSAADLPEVNSVPGIPAPTPAAPRSASVPSGPGR